jgi:teichuronic acid biosynthesis glycosyltransferase TuaC
MKVLFVSSGNKKNGISPIVYNQGESLKNKVLKLEYFVIKGKGWLGYFKNLIALSQEIRKGNYDIIHAHYSLSGFLVSLVAPFHQKVVVSLMGSFKKETIKYYLIHFLIKYHWKAIIVKSEKMKKQIGIINAYIISNGVDISKFVNNKTPKQLKEELGLDLKKKIIVFVSNPERKEKNYTLCKNSVEGLKNEDIILIPVFNKAHHIVAKYMLLADVLMLTSVSEGSPNVIKEAMAAGCPIVTTNVGDVSYLLNGLDGSYIMNTFNAKEGTALLAEALKFGKRTDGVSKLVSLNLTSEIIANKIATLYQSI